MVTLSRNVWESVTQRRQGPKTRLTNVRLQCRMWKGGLNYHTPELKEGRNAKRGGETPQTSARTAVVRFGRPADDSISYRPSHMHKSGVRTCVCVCVCGLALLQSRQRTAPILHHYHGGCWRHQSRPSLSLLDTRHSRLLFCCCSVQRLVISQTHHTQRHKGTP